MSVDPAGNEGTAAAVSAIPTVVPAGDDLSAMIEEARQAVLAEAGSAEAQETAGEPEGTSGAPATETTPPKSETEAQEEGGETDADDGKPMSRREAFKLAEERLEELRKQEAANKELQAKLDERKRQDEALDAEVKRALSSQEEYAQLEQRSRKGDRRAGAALEQIDANRDFFGKLVEKASRDVQGYFASKVLETTRKVGLEDAFVVDADPQAIIQKAFEAGQKTVRSELEPELETLRAASKGTRVARASSQNASPVGEGGKAAANYAAIDEMFNPDGSVKEEYIQAARRGELQLT